MPETASTAADANESAGALDGIRVVDLTTVLMGPMACRMLGDHGADVIRVESLDGDSTRNGLPARSAGMSGFSLNIQRNKRSLALDLKSAAGKAAMQRLLASSDVLVTNMRAAALERLGLGADALRSQHPHLICCRANGYGSGGPYRDKAAYDDAIQAASGLSNLIGRITGEPGFVPAVVADKVTGLHVVEAVLAALFHRERTGMAQSIEVPMFETMVAFNLVEHYRGAVFEPPEGPFGYDRLLTPHRRPYPTADGWVCLLPYNDAQYRAFFAFVDRPDLASDPRFADHNSRIAHIDDLYALFGQLSVRRTTDEWIGYCDEHSIPAARVMDLADLDADPQLAAVGLVSIAEHPTEGSYRYVADPVVYSATPTRLRRHAPLLGEHAVEILSELGYNPSEIDALRDEGVIVEPN
ncbi:MAG: CoA transferase [Acidimicrobiaceae bacterium]|nr:CoA transferase [Acidimicrobiaceae bacterium]